MEVERLEGDNKYHAEQHGLQVMHFKLWNLKLLHILTSLEVHLNENAAMPLVFAWFAL